MTKDEVSKVVSGHNLNLEKKQWRGTNWEFEEEGSRCTISFDANTATVVKKKKTVVTD
jgi:hypothetical protein